MSDGQFDMTELRAAKEYGAYLKALHGPRNLQMNSMEEMFLLIWDEESKVSRRYKNVKLTKNPQARNRLLGAIRLLIATDPQWSIPKPQETLTGGYDSDALEKYSALIWNAAGRVRNDPVHYDMIRSALVFDEFHISITSTEDLVNHSAGMPRAAQVQAEEAAKRTPYLFDVQDPRLGYPDLGSMGLMAFYQEKNVMVGTIWDQFVDGKKVLPESSYKRYSTVTLSDLYDLEKRQVWIAGQERPLVQEAHNLPFIPWVVHVVEGSRLFSKPEYQRTPFLYSLHKSGLWSRENLILTVIYTMAFSIGANPVFVESKNQQGEGVKYDWSIPGGKVSVPYGGGFAPLLNKGVIDPSIMQSMEIANQITEDSTLYAQTLGQPLGGNPAFSLQALLNQAGRLPLTVPKLKGGWGAADAMRMALLWQKLDEREGKARYMGETMTVTPEEIPDDLEVESILEINLPQDKMQAANIAKALTDGENPISSVEWVRENILQMGQSEQMDEQIWSEQAGKLRFKKFMLEQLMAIKQLEQGVFAPQGNPATTLRAGQGIRQPGIGGMGQGMGEPGMMMGPGEGAPLPGPMEQNAEGNLAPPGPVEGGT